MLFGDFGTCNSGYFAVICVSLLCGYHFIVVFVHQRGKCILQIQSLLLLLMPLSTILIIFHITLLKCMKLLSRILNGLTDWVCVCACVYILAGDDYQPLPA